MKKRKSNWVLLEAYFRWAFKVKNEMKFTVSKKIPALKPVLNETRRSSKKELIVL